MEWSPVHYFVWRLGAFLAGEWALLQLHVSIEPITLVTYDFWTIIITLGGESCLKWGCFFMLPPLNCICHYKLRRDIKADHGIDQGGCIRDALIVNFCFCCALIQVITFVFLACLGQACCRLAKIFDLELDREIVTPLLQMKKKHYYFRKRSSSDADKSEIFNKSEKIICLFWSRVLGLVPVCKQLTKFFRVPGKVVKSSERKISMLIYFLLGKVFYNWEWSFLRRTTSTGDCFFL